MTTTAEPTTAPTTNTNGKIKSNRGRKAGSPNTVYNIPLAEFSRVNITTVPVAKKLAIKLFGADVAKIASGEPIQVATPANTIGITVVG